MPGFVTMPEPAQIPGWKHVYTGKVRDLYVPAEPHPRGDVMLVVASDRISAYDWVLPTEIPGKGAVLTALTIPAIFTATQSVPGAAVGFAAALFLSLRGKPMITVALGGAAAVWLVEGLLLSIL